jgi:hypothetical protein
MFVRDRAGHAPLQMASEQQNPCVSVAFGPPLAKTRREGPAMFHPDTQFLIDHWTDLAQRAEARGGVPDRSALDPIDLGLRLPRAFVADLGDGTPAFRLAGDWIETFHARPLKTVALLSLWKAESQVMIAAAIAQAIREARPVVVVAQVGAHAATLEIVLTPLRGPGGAPDRLLGLYAPTGTLSLGKDDPRLLTARLCIGAGRPGRRLGLATIHGRRVA